MKYFIIAGEVSGDLHGGNLVKELTQQDQQAECMGVGGPHLAAAGVDLLFGLDRLAFMGFFEVVKNLRTIRQNFKDVKNAITRFQPDVIILIDYPGFNLRMAKWCKQQGYKVVYYISPKFWAWREQRVEKVKAYVDMMLCILPFEQAFYQRHGYPAAHFVGHPLLDVIPSREANPEQPQVIALLPGSRKQEIKSLWPLMLDVASRFPNEQFVITGMTAMAALYPTVLPANVQLVYDQTYETLQQSKAAVVCSGTATLETALFGVPQVVVYKTSWLNYQIGKRVAKVHFISLPNLIANERLVAELLQQDCTASKISQELEKLLSIPSLKPYQILQEKIGKQGATKNAAMLIRELLVMN